MRSFVLQHGLLFGVALLLVGTGLILIWNTLTYDPLANLVTTTVEEGVVEQVVSVAGVTRSRNTASLAFPVSGVVAEVSVSEGQLVEKGDLLATLGTAKELASLTRAEAEVAIAEAALSSLLIGARAEVRSITSAEVTAARAEVERVTTKENLLVENARAALYSTGLVARTKNQNEDAPPPTITGTYRCGETGTYDLRMYSSNAQSGYSITMSGLEAGSITGGINQAVALGTCGLYIQLTPGANYHNSLWTIDIPNQSDDTYITLKNALTEAEENAKSAIASVNEALIIAERTQILENAGAEPEAVAEAEARVTQAKATVAELTVALADRSIIAPFAGTVTTVDILAGETAGLTPVITLLATDAFEVVARVPEIDITKIAVGQPARIRFDAAAKEEKVGRVSFIASLPTEIDGVAYFEVKLVLEELPPWLRGGLNADIDIITAASNRGVKIPTRYAVTTGNTTVVRTLTTTQIASTTIQILFAGNDGYLAVDGLIPGTTIVAP